MGKSKIENQPKVVELFDSGQSLGNPVFRGENYFTYKRRAATALSRNAEFVVEIGVDISNRL